jgi:hypothetical protein
VGIDGDLDADGAGSLAFTGADLTLAAVFEDACALVFEGSDLDLVILKLLVEIIARRLDCSSKPCLQLPPAYHRSASRCASSGFLRENI